MTVRNPLSSRTRCAKPGQSPRRLPAVAAVSSSHFAKPAPTAVQIAAGARAMKELASLASEQESSKFSLSLSERALDAAQDWVVDSTPVVESLSKGVVLCESSRSSFMGQLRGTEVEAELNRQATLLKGLLRDFVILRDVVWHLQDDVKEVMQSRGLADCMEAKSSGLKAEALSPRKDYESFQALIEARLLALEESLKLMWVEKSGTTQEKFDSHPSESAAAHYTEVQLEFPKDDVRHGTACFSQTSVERDTPQHHTRFKETSNSFTSNHLPNLVESNCALPPTTLGIESPSRITPANAEEVEKHQGRSNLQTK